MKEGPDITRIAALIGDPARANILTALMSGKALTASELACEAGITAQTASGHLAKLTDGGLVSPRKSGRHKYFNLATPDVAALLESLMGLAATQGHLRNRPGPKDAALRHARVCYNHLAGDMGTRLFDSLRQRGFLTLGDPHLSLSDKGEAFLTSLGLDLTPLRQSRTPMCRECLDWSERRSHLAGTVGRGLLTLFEDQNWARRLPDSRVVRFTPKGQAAFDAAFPAQ